jgi:RimJ/RimL family protein N-acetyltransferase
VNDRRKPSRADEERTLMPQSSPRPAVRHRERHRGGPTRYGSNTSEREYSALGDQLNALEQDIEDAREASRRARRTPGMTFHPEHEQTKPSLHGEPVVLADGAHILIRPIEPSDARELEAGFEHLGAVSRYRRFLTPIDHLSDRQLTYLTHVDHITHEALLAIDIATGEEVAIARFVRDPEHLIRAEVAIVVADHWQGRGVGGALADRLRDRARSVGIERVTARMLIGNRGGRRLLDRIADEISENEDAGTIDIAARLKPASQS